MSALVERHGIVIDCQDGRARIRLESEPACSGCGSRGTCASNRAQAKIVEITLAQPASPGSVVTLSLPESSIASAALLGYFLPAGGLLLGAVTAAALFVGDLAAVSGAVIGFLGGLSAVRFISRSVIGETMHSAVCTSLPPIGEKS